MNTCTSCPAPALWRDADGRTFCGSHVPANGKPLARLPAEPEPPEPDIVDRLLDESQPLGDYCDSCHCVSVKEDAAAEIRRLRALLEAAGDKSGSC
jgi:hypothetical protein